MEIKKFFAGSVCFSHQFEGMKKPEEFIVYPFKSEDKKISIQSDHRFAFIELETGKGVLSARYQDYPTSFKLLMDIQNKKAKNIQISEKDFEILKLELNKMVNKECILTK